MQSAAGGQVLFLLDTCSLHGGAGDARSAAALYRAVCNALASLAGGA